MKQMSKKISFLIPFYNESQHLTETIEILTRVARKKLNEFEVILVNDGSTDDSEFKIAGFLNDSHYKLIRFPKNRGFGSAYLSALENARLSHAMYLPADGDVQEGELMLLLEKWNGESLLVQSCANLKSRQFHRFLISRLYTMILQFLTKTRLPYYNGLNIFPRPHHDLSKLKDYGFCTQAALLLLVHQQNPTIQILETQCRFHDETSKALTLGNFISAIQFFLYIIKSRWIRFS